MSTRILAFDCSSKSRCGILLCHGGEDGGGDEDGRQDK